MKYMVNIGDNPNAVLDGWTTVKAKTHSGAAVKALKNKITKYAALETVWARVHGEKDPKHPNGSPALIHTFKLQIHQQA